MLLALSPSGYSLYEYRYRYESRRFLRTFSGEGGWGCIYWGRPGRNFIWPALLYTPTLRGAFSFHGSAERTVNLAQACNAVQERKSTPPQGRGHSQRTAHDIHNIAMIGPLSKQALPLGSCAAKSHFRCSGLGCSSEGLPQNPGTTGPFGAV